MSKKLDAIIFGATGFAGKVVVRDAVELLKDYEWGIAGRNETRLQQVLKEIGSELKVDLNKIPTIVADVSDEKSVIEMAKQCKIVLNCCGPYQLYGEIVVKACIEAGTHHVDISGEPQYIDGMQLKYHDWAKEKCAYIISTCAFESIPYEMGVVYAEKNFEGTINSIEAYFENTWINPDINSKTILNIGTWESAMYAIKNFRKMLSLKQKINAQIQCPEVKPTLRVKNYIQKPDFAQSYFIPFPSVDRTVVERSQRRLYEIEQKRPIQFETYIGFRSLFLAIFIPFYALFIMLLAIMPCTYKLLIKYAEHFTFGRFTNDGPTIANQQAHHFSMIFKAKGWSKDGLVNSKPTKQQLTRISGVNPCYGLTSVALILTAKTILRESDKMPGSGGVLPPGAAFYKTSLIEELSKHKYGLKFEVLK